MRNTAPHIAIQGIVGSFHHLAAERFFGPDIQLRMCRSFPTLFRKLASEEADYGVVAIENSVAGTLLPNYALLRNTDCTIIGEIYLRIEQQLLALPGQTIDEIMEVHSHPMAILQCQAFFEAYPHIRLIEADDTAASARRIAENQMLGAGAIASHVAADRFGLKILASNIETNHRNFTRFLIIQPGKKREMADQTANKASLFFHLSHQSGTLARVLTELASHGMNLSKIQSLPIPGKEWEYFFHIDLEFEAQNQYLKALQAIDPLTDSLRILGEYPRGIKNETVAISSLPYFNSISK
jgi:prephenate dehydratase